MSNGSQLQDFMNPKAAMTVGAASAMVIAFTTSLAISFGWPQPVIALALSGLFAFLQVSAAKDVGNALQRGAYFVIITLVIFSAARGGNSTLSDGETLLRSGAGLPQVSLVTSAYAQEPILGTNMPTVGTNAPPAITNAPPPKIFVRW